jgi:hypothetical protein
VSLAFITRPTPVSSSKHVAAEVFGEGSKPPAEAASEVGEFSLTVIGLPHSDDDSGQDDASCGVVQPVGHLTNQFNGREHAHLSFS